MTIDLNVEKITPRKGQIVYEIAPALHNVVVAGTQATPIVAGDFVKLNASSTNTACPEVLSAGASDAVFGIVKITPRKNSFVAGEKIAIAQSGDVIWCEAGASIAVGAELYHNADNEVVSSDPGSGTKCGIALTKATAKGDLVQVQIKL